MSLTILALVALTIFAGGMIKGAVGLGLPMIAIPVLSIFIGVPQAVTIVAVPMAVTNAWQMWQFRAARHGVRFLPAFLVAGVAAIFPGTWLLSQASGEYLELALGITVLGYVGLRLSAVEFHLSERAGSRLAPVVGFGAGFLQGATGLSGVVGATYFHAIGLVRQGFMFSLASMFFLFIMIQLALLVGSGISTEQSLLTGVFALLPAGIGLFIGNAIAGRLERRVFDRLIYLVLMASAVPLIWSSLTIMAGR
ncbi:sulfite exporter TauE/SafE family protein [Arsenicitalea aurantiaca]|uniref:Probable membrane transporter protein n=1 Tax=Arsenicitalea aurantiaca TaxID=1783274 RepID=A0A433X5S9_9HYPH|nr:sulfite exporter TauE/SafE family protein [Arsenicitalea aurantiaca]RUT29409.1 sulfite exporter TauE/SafE family protein [Arsenicitalea aurantiaca]